MGPSRLELKIVLVLLLAVAILALLAGFVRLQRDVLGAERTRVIGLRDEGVIADEALRRIERDLDLVDARLG